MKTIGQINMLIFLTTQVGTFPIKYLGVPINPSWLHVIDWLPLVEKNNKKLDIWKGGLMSIAGRVVLIDASLSNTAIYLLPKTIIEKLDKTRRTFFWQGGGTKKKYHLIRWTKICKHEKKGGLGIRNLRKMNISLMTKWWWKLDNEIGLWQEIVRFKYLKNDPIHIVRHRQNDSAIWFDLLKIKDVYLQGRKMVVRNGQKTLFWKDTWVFERPLASLFPDLFKICLQLNASVAFVKQNSANFSRWLVDGLRNDWEQIMCRVNEISVTNDEDRVIWNFGKKARFSVRSMYKALTVDDSGPYFKKIWKGKIPAKIKIFL
jgi:hypothetical protein